MLVALVATSLAACVDHPAGHLYVTVGRSDEVVRLDAEDGSILRRIDVDRIRYDTDEPHAVATSPDGSLWYVTVAHGQPSLWKFETADDRLVGRVDLPSGGAAMIGMSPDGSTAYIPDYDRAGDRVGRVAAVRLHDLVVTAHEAVCEAPHEAAVHPSGEPIAVVCSGSDEIVFLDARDLTVERRFATPSDSSLPHDAVASGHMPGAGNRPMSAAWSPDGTLLAVALHSRAAVWLLGSDGVSRSVVPVDDGPAQVMFVDDRIVVSANRMGGTLSVVDVRRAIEVRRIDLDAS